MKILSNLELKKLDPKDRQSAIIDGLEYLRDNKVKEVRDLAVQLLKLYLLEKGEGIDVDFSARLNKIFNFSKNSLIYICKKSDGSWVPYNNCKSKDDAVNYFKENEGIEPKECYQYDNAPQEAKDAVDKLIKEK